MKYYCHNCNKIVDEVKIPRCECGNVYDLEYEYHKHIIYSIISDDKITHWKYVEFMPINSHNTKILTMGEGGTPLLGFNRLSSICDNLFFKCEFMNPTGSFKDRASALEVTLAQGSDEIVVATTGNMGSSIAAYAAFAGIPCTIFIPKTIHNSNIDQIEMYGANIIRIDGDYNNALERTEEYYLTHPNIYLAGDYGIRVEGTKSIGFEISEQLEWQVPEYIIVPVGNGTLLYSIYKAFNDLLKVGITDKMPKIIGVKSDEPEYTNVSSIAVKTPILSYVVDKFAFLILEVSDEEIMEARKTLAENGLFVEPGGAATYAGLLQLQYIDYKMSGDVVVLLTGHGLKGI